MYRLAKITNMKVVPRLTHFRKFSSTLKPKQYKQNIDTTFSKYGNSTQRLDRPMSINSITKGLTNGLCNTLEFMSTCSEYTTNFMLKPINFMVKIVTSKFFRELLKLLLEPIVFGLTMVIGTMLILAGMCIAVFSLMFIESVIRDWSGHPRYDGVCPLD